MSTDQARLRNAARYRKQTEALPTQLSLGDRNPRTGDYEVLGVDGSRGEQAQKIFNTELNPGLPVRFTPLSQSRFAADQGIGSDTAPTQGAGTQALTTSPPPVSPTITAQNCRGYMQAQVFNCPHPEPVDPIGYLMLLDVNVFATINPELQPDQDPDDFPSTTFAFNLSVSKRLFQYFLKGDNPKLQTLSLSDPRIHNRGATLASSSSGGKLDILRRALTQLNANIEFVPMTRNTIQAPFYLPLLKQGARLTLDEAKVLQAASTDYGVILQGEWGSTNPKTGAPLWVDYDNRLLESLEIEGRVDSNQFATENNFTPNGHSYSVEVPENPLLKALGNTGRMQHNATGVFKSWGRGNPIYVYQADGIFFPPGIYKTQGSPSVVLFPGHPAPAAY